MKMTQSLELSRKKYMGGVGTSHPQFKVTMKDLQIKRTLGTGSFGKARARPAAEPLPGLSTAQQSAQSALSALQTAAIGAAVADRARAPRTPRSHPVHIPYISQADPVPSCAILCHPVILGMSRALGVDGEVPGEELRTEADRQGAPGRAGCAGRRSQTLHPAPQPLNPHLHP